MEWFETGVLKEADWGMSLAFGDVKGMLDLVPKIARREGLGDLLAEGVKRAAERLGKDAEKAAMHVKGLEMAADGVRASKGEAVVHAVSPGERITCAPMPQHRRLRLQGARAGHPGRHQFYRGR
jgi:aldehyde:ferredoxin oxidoreductase